MRIVLVGGGTGGHFYPLMAIAEAVRERDKQTGENSQLIYMGPEPYNQQALTDLNITYAYCPAGKQRMYRSFRNFTDKFKIVGGIFCAFFKLLTHYPDAVMSKGGYTTVPVVIAARLLRIPVVVHESDAVPGRSNLLAAKFARYIGVAFAEVAPLFPAGKVTQVGMPIRRAFLQPVNNPAEFLGINNDKPILLVTGGSSGAERINNFILAALPRLLTKFTVVHQVGDTHLEKVTADASALLEDPEMLNHYYAFGHLERKQFAAAMQAATIVVTRAGSTSLFEIALLGKPAIVIPIPEAISRDQRTNAYTYSRHTQAVVLEEQNLSDDILVAEIENIIGDPASYQKMSQAASSFTTPDAAYTLADVLRSIAREHE